LDFFILRSRLVGSAQVALNFLILQSILVGSGLFILV